MIIVSACLVGLKTRYDGDDNLIEAIRELVARGEAIPICPEQLGGLPTPRTPADLSGGDGGAVLDGAASVVDRNGIDVTEAFRRGAEESLSVARMTGATLAILKERSPSCGLRRVWIDGELADGRGVTAALLERHGVRIESEEDWLDKS
ncbi:DUF523 domain-containing protein [bacterium]|nr:DUF523 domain-containing protein [bacterium]